MLSITGYTINEEIYESAQSLVYRARRQNDNQPVILKVLKEAHSSPERSAWFKREYEMTHSLNLPGVIKVYELLTEQDRWVMVLEDFGGDSLDLLGLAGNLRIVDFLELAIKISDILGQIHQQHIIHKDINPSNIVFNPKTGQVKLIGFGVSTSLSQESQTFRHLNTLEGTLAYISPEQTGRMNRGVDYRTDFYSLGVTFYELLSGQLPFQSDDPMTLIHSHIARAPLSLQYVTPDVPPIVAQIVMKLMAKNAEERYQSAYGAKADLERCLQHAQNLSGLQDLSSLSFALGQHDVSDRFQLPQKLYGRKREVDAIISAFERASASSLSPKAEGMKRKAEMILVSGYAGIGKSALVQEVHKPLSQRRGYFIAGKFDQFQRNTPYSALLQAFRSLIQQFLAESEAQLVTWRERLLAALGPNGQVILEVIPDLALVIGPQPPVVELDPVQTKNRFNLAFQNFVRVFTQLEYPLVLFLDDLQWSDTASLKLLQLLMSASDRRNLFVIGAYRDNEVNQSHPLMLAVNEIRQAGGIVHHIVLSPLKLPHVARLIADTFHCSLEQASPLAELVQAKTGGNPFFVNEFLKSLYAQKLITFVPPPPSDELGEHRRGTRIARAGWRWDLAKIQVQNVTDNVVELISGNIQQLKAETQQALKLAACIGNQFDLQALAVIYEKSPQETAVDLWEAVTTGLVLPLSGAYKFVTLDVPELAEALRVEYKFAHDRIRQAVYSLIPAADRQARHYRIGRLLLQNTPSDRRDERIFDIVNHLNVGFTLTRNDLERYELARLNLLTGQKARRSAAHKPAFNYFKAGLRLLDESSWEKQYDLTLALHVEAINAAYSSGDFEPVDSLAEAVFKQAKTILNTVKVYDVKIRICVAQNKMLEAIRIALDLLKLLGVTLPRQPTESDVMLGMQKVQSSLAERPVEELINLPEMTDPYKLAAMHILSSMSTAAYNAIPELYSLISFERTYLSIRYGNALVSPAAYASYGLFLCGVAGDIETGYQFGKLALNLVDKLDATQFKARTWVTVYAFTTHWKEHLKVTLGPSLEAYQSGLEAGDVSFSTGALATYTRNAYFAGKKLTELDPQFASHSEAIGRLKHKRNKMIVGLYWQVVLNLLGQVERPYYLSGEAYNEEKLLPLHLEANDKYLIFNLHLNKLVLCYLFQEYCEALENATMAEKYLDGVTGGIVVPLFHFYDSLARLAVYHTLSNSSQKRVLEKVAANQEKMKIWTDYAPMNFQHKFYLVEAEYARVVGRGGDAREYYDQAITLAQENEYINEEALACELAAKFYLDRGQTRLARYYLHDAYYAYQQWGAQAKVKDLEAHYPRFLTKTGAGALQIPLSISATARHAASILDLTSVAQASQALSGEIVLDRLLRKLMEIVIQNAGAQRGMLILEKQGLEEQRDIRREDASWVVEAEAIADGQCDKITVLKSASITNQSVPKSVINYVLRTQKEVVLNNAVAEGQFTADPYILARQPKSLLAMPLLHQSKLKGILYLENDLATGAFTPDRLEVLNLLSAQAAISLENARLYNTLEQKVAERTTELARVNAQLEQDIATRKRVEQALRESEEKYRNVSERANDGILIVQDGRIGYCNPQLAAMLGYAIEEMLNVPFENFLASDKRVEVREHYERRLKGVAVASRYESVGLHRDGHRIDIEINAGLIEYESRPATLAIVRDITERKQAEAALREAKEVAERNALTAEEARRMAEAANQAKSIFLANMSHELRTPLNAILGFSELMTHDPNLTPNQRENLGTINQSGEHLLALINDVLELSKIEAGRTELQEEGFDLHRLLLGLEEMFRLRVENKGLTLAFERAPDVPRYVQADQGKLRQVLINLLGNAVKFTEEGGITLRVREGKEIGRLGDWEMEGQVESPISVQPLVVLHFEVEDTGVGIAPEELDAVFDAFVQTTSGQQSQQGTGLGLPISREFVRMMGGDLTVSSPPPPPPIETGGEKRGGAGSTFMFDVRVGLVDQSEILTLESGITPWRIIGLEPGQPVYRLLVVEDVETNRQLLVKLLQSVSPSTPSLSEGAGQGFEVRGAANGQEAIEIWEEWKPHLIWMDIRMPVLDGLEATKHIKSVCRNDASCSPPVIVALTASAFEEERAAALAEGCDDFVRKPFREVDIFDVLTKHLGVQFVYEDEEVSRQVDRGEGIELGSDALALTGVPAEWWMDMRQATIEGDLEWMARLIAQIQAASPAMADRLTKLAYNFEHEEILRLIEQAVRQV